MQSSNSPQSIDPEGQRMKNLNVNFVYIEIICGSFAAAEFRLKKCIQGITTLRKARLFQSLA